MLETSGSLFVLYAMHGALFILFCIKFWGLCSTYVIPYLKKQKNEKNEQFTALQEQHLVLVSQKKQLATQFLQQEKQIALLTAKLESWHAACHHNEKERENVVSDRAREMNERAALQQHAVAQERLAKETGLRILDLVSQNVEKEAHVIFDQYMQRACAQLSGVEKKDTVYESSYAKKTEGA